MTMVVETFVSAGRMRMQTIFISSCPVLLLVARTLGSDPLGMTQSVLVEEVNAMWRWIWTLTPEDRQVSFLTH